MGCACGKSSSSTQAKSFTVKAPDGKTTTYRSEIEAKAAAQRTGGTMTPAR